MLSGVLRDRKTLTLLAAAVVAMAVVGCRGGGSNPSPDDQVLPVIGATVPASVCLNQIQPDGAPQFADIDLARFETLADGLKVYDIELGTGDKPVLADAVAIEYSVWLEDGCMFDTSYTTPGPATIALIGLIRGWQEGITAMQEGGTRVIQVPPELAFGAVGVPPAIPPNATLFFHVNLIERITIAEAQATATVEAANASATTVAANCVNRTQPDGAPVFAEIDLSRFEPLVDGLRFYEIEPGTGDIPALTDTVSVEYTGWLEDGCMFDTSFVEPGPITFPLGNVIEGWQQSLSAMKEGATWMVEISPDLGYGPGGFAPSIPPNATLFFYVNLISKG